MRRCVTLLALFAVAVGLNAQSRRQVGPLVKTYPTYLVKQDFETPGYDNGETWTETGTGILDDAYIAAPLVGASSFYMGFTNTQGETVVVFAAKDEVWGYFYLRPLQISGAAFTDIGTMRDAGDNTRVILSVPVGGGLGISAGGAQVNTVSTMSINTTYQVWFHYKKGTGADAVVDIGFSTTGIRPTSGNNFVQSTVQLATAQVSKFVIGRAANRTHTYIFDKIRVDDELVGDNPP